MHIGFDISQTGALKAGCGFFAHALVEAMLRLAPAHRFALYPAFGDFYFDANMPEANPYPGTQVSYGPRHRSLDAARAFWNSPQLEAALGRPDVIHSNNFWCPTQLSSTRLVYTLYDLSFVANPQWTTEVNRAGCWEGVSRAALHADWIVAISKASRDHFLEVFPDFPRERIEVIYPCSRYAAPQGEGVRPASLANVPAGGFWLGVGTIEPRKNQRRIAEAYARYLALGGTPMPLVFAGGHGWLMEDFRAHLEQLGIAAHVIITGYVSDAELVWLYRNCYANLYVSLFEGFGLPVLEGMQLGAATIASNATSIPEVAGDAAILLAPEDVEGIAQAMLGLARDPAARDALSRRALIQAARFRWEDSAAATLDVYARAAAAPKRAPPAETGQMHWSSRLLVHGGKLYERAVRSLRRP
jgi:glycosyltransferase involved in cell wall biosynthesis